MPSPDNSTTSVGIAMEYGAVHRTRSNSLKPIGQQNSLVIEPTTRWWHDAVFYQIFVRSFADGDGDGIGDFQGLLSKLDCLASDDSASLGITALWLMPIFESPSSHGYDVSNYETLHSGYGSIEDFRNFLHACHDRGIRVILDLMLNHCSVTHPWFREACTSPDSLRRHWFLWADKDPGWKCPWNQTNPVWHPCGDQFYYGIFSPSMPDLNFRNPAVLEEFLRIARYWLQMGVDGFRLDAVKHLLEDGDQLENVPETHTVLKQFTQTLRHEYPEVLFVGEIWSAPDDVATYYGKGEGDELDLAFGFNTAWGILNAVKKNSARQLFEALGRDERWLPTSFFNATFLANHDMDRLATLLNSDPQRQRLAAALLLTLPGTPFLYFGEELGLQNTKGASSEKSRGPFPWTSQPPALGFSAQHTLWTHPSPLPPEGSWEEQVQNPGSLWHHYRTLIALRKKYAVLRTGALTHVGLPSTTGNTLVFERAIPGQVALVCCNFSKRPSRRFKGVLHKQTCDTAQTENKQNWRWAPIFPTSHDNLSFAAHGQRFSVGPLPAHSVAIFLFMAQEK